MSEHERFTKGIYAWVGFHNKWIAYENVERAAGTTPLRGIIYFGMLIVVLSIFLALKLYIAALQTPSATRNGYASIMILMLFLGGVIITILGMIGEYLARIFMEEKNRPIYFVRETNVEERN